MTADEPTLLADPDAIRARLAGARIWRALSRATGDCADHDRLLDEDLPALLALVERQAAEIERLEDACADASTEFREAANAKAVLEAENAELWAELESARRRMTHGTTRRGCLALDCWAEFQLFSPDDPATGWVQAQALGGYLCPVHAGVLASHRPRPRYTPQRMACSCGWESAPVLHRGAGVELWLDHSHEVTEGLTAAAVGEWRDDTTPRATPDVYTLDGTVEQADEAAEEPQR